MASFRQLCSISVTHSYFADGRCRDLEFVPTHDTAYLVEKAGLLVKNNYDGVCVFCESSSIDTLRQRTADPDEPSALVFKVFPRDPGFAYYTEPGIFNEEAMLYFGNRAGETGGGLSGRLHQGEYVSGLDFEKLDSPLFSGVFGKRDRLVRPAFIVSIDLTPAVGVLSDASSPPGDYVVAFKARETFWRYYLLGEMKKRTAFIIDRHNGYTFEYVGEASLPDSRTALPFLSNEPIPLQENSDCFFQLKEKGVGGGKILIRRLPVATPHQFSKEVINGQETAVSDIFINC
jgi:hypothetical protein